MFTFIIYLQLAVVVIAVFFFVIRINLKFSILGIEITHSGILAHFQKYDFY